MSLTGKHQIFLYFTLFLSLLIVRAIGFPSMPMPASGDYYVIQGWQHNIVMAVPCNLNGDDRLDWIAKSYTANSGTLILEARTSDDNFLWAFDTRIASSQTQDNNGMHEAAVPWDIDGDGIDEVLAVMFEGGAHYMVALNGRDGSIKGKIREPSSNGASLGANHYCCIAYLDGTAGPPYAVFSSGIYSGGAVWAFYWDPQSNNLKHKWTYAHSRSTSAHELLAYDIDGDGRQEVFYGGTAINPDGTKKWSLTDYGHGHVDGMQPGDLNPANPGKEVYYHVESGNPAALMVDANGRKLWSYSKSSDVHHGWACNVNNSYPGDECFALLKNGSWKALYSAAGQEISGPADAHRPPEWTGDDLYDPGLNLITWGNGGYSGFSYAADVGGGDNHGAEELILLPKWNSSRTITIRFNRGAKSYPSRWQNRHYRQDVVHCGAGYGALRATFQVEGPADSTPPSAPSNLTAVPQGEFKISLTWLAAEDAESGIQDYKVYRNGAEVGRTRTAGYTDNGLDAETVYLYEVSAVNGVGLEGSKSASVSASTLADNNPPVLVSAAARGESTEVIVIFSEPLDHATATDPVNYMIDQGVAVSGAALGSDLRSVTLTTSTLSENVDYTLTVNNVHDRAPSPNTIAANSQTLFQYIATLEITQTTAATNKLYTWDVLAVSKAVYIDRAYTFTAIPAQYTGLQYLMTANDDKAATANPLITFDINQEVTVYVGYAGSSPPSWLAGWTDTGDDLVTTDRTLHVYSKDFAAGTVSLGNNGTAQSMYTVVVDRASGGPVVQVNTFEGGDDLEVKVCPNPFNPGVSIKIQNAKYRRQNVDIRIFNIQGNLINILHSGFCVLNSSYKWNATNHPSGIYILKVRTGQWVRTTPLILSK